MLHTLLIVNYIQIYDKIMSWPQGLPTGMEKKCLLPKLPHPN